MLVNWVTFANNLFQWLLTDYECSSWCQAIFQKLRTMNHRTADFSFKQLFKVQLIELTVSCATYHSQSVPMALADYMCSYEIQTTFSEIKNSMHSAQKEQIYFQLNRFISLLFYQLCRKRNCRERERMNTINYTGSLNLSYIQSSPTTGGNH